MSKRIRLRYVSVAMVATVLTGLSLVAAQTSAPKPTAKQPTATQAAAQPRTAQPAAAQPRTAQPAAAQPAAAVDDAARRSEILASTAWRRAMFELNEWLQTQKRYTPEQVAKIKSDFSAKVQRMSADQLQFMLGDIDAKLKVLETPQAQDARAWLGHYLSILSDQKREEVLRKLPNIETMTAPQLQQEIAAIEGRRLAEERQSKQVQQLRNTSSNPWNQTSKLAEQSYVRDHSPGAGGYSSPYRAPSNSGKRPFEDVRTGTNMGFYVNPYGGVGLTFGGGF
jgi:hypothetical protein